MLKKKVAVYKLQERDMGDTEKKYSQLGNLEAHYFFAKNNDKKFLFTTESNLFKEEVEHVLLTIPDGSHGFIARYIAKGTYPEEPNSSFKVPTQWADINKNKEKPSKYNWIALEIEECCKISSDIKGIPQKPSPQYMDLDINIFKN